MKTAILVATTFAACAVEMVEALTIVLAVGITRGWHAVRLGIAAALAALAVIVAVLGPALTLIPLDTLRLVIGFLLLAFGLQWLRKAVLRAGGAVALHDEDRIFEEERAVARSHAATGGEFDWYAFTLSFKGVFLEGLEVAFIVIAFGDTHHNLALGALAAGAALVTVVVLGVVVHGPLSRVPENALKFAVGLMLISYGTFWGGESVGVGWPGGDLAILVLVAWYAIVASVLVLLVRRRHGAAAISMAEAG
ncbi:MAG TPA: hypothetical protein VEP49_03545 [Acidimicrobiia bacterium]|nr:hypothetical protein [Acidimicrobiia bacterium]